MLSPAKRQSSDHVSHVTNGARTKTKSRSVLLCLLGTSACGPCSPGFCFPVFRPEVLQFGLSLKPPQGCGGQSEHCPMEQWGAQSQEPRAMRGKERLGAEKAGSQGRCWRPESRVHLILAWGHHAAARCPRNELGAQPVTGVK